MGGGGGVGDEALGVAQVVGDVDEPERVDEAEGRVAPARHVEGDDAAAGAHLDAGQLVLGVAGQSRIKHVGQAAAPAEVCGDVEGVGGVALDAHGQGLQALDQEPGVEGAHRRAGMTQDGGQGVFHVIQVVGEDGAAQRAALAVDVLGGRIDDDVGAHLQRPLQHRRGEHVVDDEAGAGPMGQLRDPGQVDDLQGRVGRRFQEHAGRLAAERRFPLAEVGAIDELRLDAVAGQQLGDDVVARPEQGARRHHAVAGLQSGEQGGEHRGHAARRGPALRGPFEEGQPLLEHGNGGVGVARIDVAFLLALEGALRLLRRVVDVTRRHEEALAGLREPGALEAAAHQLRGLAPGLSIGGFRVHVVPSLPLALPVTGWPAGPGHEKSPDRRGQGFTQAPTF